ncbi:MAG: hypothetical protein HKN87_02875 [Saprospiraceae bacterium]|nr:hypothetical protein [Saprospiraceae bacterium]
MYEHAFKYSESDRTKRADWVFGVLAGWRVGVSVTPESSLKEVSLARRAAEGAENQCYWHIGSLELWVVGVISRIWKLPPAAHQKQHLEI